MSPRITCFNLLLAFPLPLMTSRDGNWGALVDTHDHDRWTGFDGMTFTMCWVTGWWIEFSFTWTLSARLSLLVLRGAVGW
jgi:hypothetical protein